jgi:hypothetical protein
MHASTSRRSPRARATSASARALTSAEEPSSGGRLERLGLREARRGDVGAARRALRERSPWRSTGTVLQPRVIERRAGNEPPRRHLRKRSRDIRSAEATTSWNRLPAAAGRARSNLSRRPGESADCRRLERHERARPQEDKRGTRRDYEQYRKGRAGDPAAEPKGARRSAAREALNERPETDRSA